MTDYDAALRAAQVRALDVLVQSWDGPFPAPAITPIVNDLIALAQAVGAVREHVTHRSFRQPGYCAACHEVGPCEVEAEADRLAAPYLAEVKA